MDALELLRSRNRFEEELPSGLKVTLRLPRIRDCIVAGSVPLPVLAHLQDVASNGKESEVATDDMAALGRFQDEIVRRAVVAIDGQPVQLASEDIVEFSQEDYDRIVAVATRQDVPPKAGTPT